MKVLNLDALAPAKRTLTLNGKTHAIEEMTVENFIATTKEAEDLEKKGGEVTFADQIEATIGMILRSIPTLPREELRRLSIEQLSVISKFLRGEMDGDEETESSEGGEKKE